MKQLYINTWWLASLLCIFLCVAMLCSSCADSRVSDEFRPSSYESILKRTLSVSTSSINFSSDGGTQSTSITSENVEWNIGSLTSWVYASQLSGKSSANVVFTAERNTNIGEARSHITNISSVDQSLGYNFPITLTQEAKMGYITPSKNSITLSAKSQGTNLDVSSNISWTYKCTSNWVKILTSSSYISISVEENASTIERTATISLQDSKSGKEYSKITVTQNGYSKITVPDVLTFDADGGTKQFSLTSDVAYTIVSSNSTWITTSPTSGTAGTKSITVSATRNNEYNERTGSIYIRVDGNNAATINITQKAATPPNPITDLKQSGNTFTSTGGNLSLTFNTTGAWTITKSSNTSWLTLSSTSGSGNGSITVRAADNPSVSSRTATLTITPANGNAVNATFTQSGRFLTLSSTSDIAMFAKGGTSNPITVSTDGTWSVTSSATSWLTVAKSGSSFTITAKENTTGVARSGVVTVELTGLSDTNRYFKTINVTQMVQGELYLNGKTSGTSDSSTSFSVNITNYGNDENWNSQISSK